MKKKINNYAIDMWNYFGENIKALIISLIPLLMYALVIAVLMITGFIPIYAWDSNMSFWKKCLWEQLINLPCLAWIASWMLMFFTKENQ